MTDGMGIAKFKQYSSGVATFHNGQAICIFVLQSCNFGQKPGLFVPFFQHCILALQKTGNFSFFPCLQVFLTLLFHKNSFRNNISVKKVGSKPGSTFDRPDLGPNSFTTKWLYKCAFSVNTVYLSLCVLRTREGNGLFLMHAYRIRTKISIKQ